MDQAIFLPSPQKLGNVQATAKTVIGYAPNKEEMYFFEGAVEGEIINPRVDSAFWVGSDF